MQTAPGVSIGDTQRLSIAELAQITNRTFAGYPVPIQHSPESFAAFCRTHSLDTAQSITLLHDGTVIGLTMLGIRQDRGWCGGFGIVPEFRGRNCARLLIDGLLERARSLGLRQLHLEVLSDNQPALRTYLRAGLKVVRPVAIFMGSAEDVYQRLDWNDLTPDPVSLTEGLFRSHPGSAVPWQRELIMVEQRYPLSAWSLEKGSERGAIVFWHNRKDGHLRVERLAFDSVPIAHALLRTAIELCRTDGESDRRPTSLFVLNEPTETPLFTLLNGLRLPILHRQEEMSILF